VQDPQKFYPNVTHFVLFFMCDWASVFITAETWALMNFSAFICEIQLRQVSKFRFLILKVKLLTYLVTYLLTYSMEQDHSWEANRFSACQETPHILWNRTFITAFISARHLSLSWARLIQSMFPQSHFLTVHLNIIVLPPGVNPTAADKYRAFHHVLRDYKKLL
jgi:hypothetical protein